MIHLTLHSLRSLQEKSLVVILNHEELRTEHRGKALIIVGLWAPESPFKGPRNTLKHPPVWFSLQIISFSYLALPVSSLLQFSGVFSCRFFLHLFLLTSDLPPANLHENNYYAVISLLYVPENAISKLHKFGDRGRDDLVRGLRDEVDYRNLL